MHFLGLFGRVRGMVMIVGKGRDDAGAQLMGFAMCEFEGRDLILVLMQQPGMLDQALQDQGLAPGQRRALAAHDRAVGKLGAGGLIGPAGKRWILAERRLEIAPAPCGKPVGGTRRTLWKTT